MLKNEVVLKDGLEVVSNVENADVVKTGETAPRRVWILVTMDDGEVLGEKPTVSAFSSAAAAEEAMRIDIHAQLSSHGMSPEHVEYSSEGWYAQTTDKRFSWEIAETEVTTFPRASASAPAQLRYAARS